MRLILRSAFAAPLLLGLGACSAMPGKTTPAVAVPQPVAAEPSYRPFPNETLAELIAAELAGQRGQPVTALGLYARQALSTRDPGVVARATQIALFLGATPTALELSRLWTQVSPENPEAQSSLTISLWRAEQYPEAIQALERVLQQTPDTDFEQLLLSGQPTTNEARDKLMSALDKLVASFPDNPHALYCRGFWRNQTGDQTGAIEDAEKALSLAPAFVSASLLKARALSDSQREDAARQLLAKALQASPKNLLLRHNYAKVLIRTGRFQEAEAQYASLAEQAPGQGEFWLAHALMAMENGHLDKAEHSLEQLVSLGQRTDEAQFYLGKLYSLHKKTEAAIAAYDAVEPGPRFLQARQELTQLLIKAGRLGDARQSLADARQAFPEARWSLTALEADILTRQGLLTEAKALLDQAIEQAPEDDALRYSRAMMAERSNDLTLFEADIRSILKRQPKNPVALNALGYTLADRTNRLEEAQALINQAIELAPNDPAIIDSMGWIQYRLGNRQHALELLQKAWSLMRDDEIGAHLGEVLWQQDRKEEARQIWKESLKHKPDSEFVRKTQQRLGAK